MEALMKTVHKAGSDEARSPQAIQPEPDRTYSDEVPKAEDVVFGLGLTLAIPLAVAVIVELWLRAAGVVN
jgi:hypothetical protein